MDSEVKQTVVCLALTSRHKRIWVDTNAMRMKKAVAKTKTKRKEIMKIKTKRMKIKTKI